MLLLLLSCSCSLYYLSLASVPGKPAHCCMQASRCLWQGMEMWAKVVQRP